MNERNTETRDPLEATLDLSGGAFNEQGALRNAPTVLQQPMPSVGVAEFVLAQQTARPRSLKLILERLSVLANAAGDRWLWGWEVNDKRRGRKTWIEGPTIKLANDLVREYGNCVLDTRVVDNGTSWTFYSRLVDLETGANRTRPYQQRKSVDMGMKDDQRTLDMVFQSGVSRSERNIVCNVLQTLTDYCVEEAKKSTLARITAKPDDARAWITGQLDVLHVDRKRVEAIYGRASANWTTTDMARIYKELRGVIDGFINADDVWPLPEGDVQPKSEQDDKVFQARKEEAETRAKAKAKAKADADAQKAGERKEAEGQTVTATGGQPPTAAPLAAPEPKPTVTMHIFDDRKKSLGSIVAPMFELGCEIEIADGKYRVFEVMEHPGGDGYMVIVSKVLGEPGSPPQTGNQSPGEAHVTAADPEVGERSGEEEPPAAESQRPAGRPKRERKAVGKLFGST